MRRQTIQVTTITQPCHTIHIDLVRVIALSTASNNLKNINLVRMHVPLLPEIGSVPWLRGVGSRALI
ncbi:hypothetical protein D3C85_1656150 [compost metagenome]